MQEYNGGLLHKEELQLRRALYASLIESKKPQGKHKHSEQLSMFTDSGSPSNVKDGEVDSIHLENKQTITGSAGFSPQRTQSEFGIKKGKKESLCLANNSVIKKRKKRETALETNGAYTESLSPQTSLSVSDISVDKLSFVDVECTSSEDRGKKRRRRRKKLDTSTGDKNVEDITQYTPQKVPRTLKVKKKRKRKFGQRNRGLSDTVSSPQSDMGPFESPAKRPKKEDKRSVLKMTLIEEDFVIATPNY